MLILDCFFGRCEKPSCDACPFRPVRSLRRMLKSRSMEGFDDEQPEATPPAEPQVTLPEPQKAHEKAHEQPPEKAYVKKRNGCLCQGRRFPGTRPSSPISAMAAAIARCSANPVFLNSALPIPPAFSGQNWLLPTPISALCSAPAAYPFAPPEQSRYHPQRSLRNSWNT